MVSVNFGWKSPDVVVCVSFVKVKIDNTPLTYSFHISIREALCIVWVGLAHQIPPVVTGLAVCETWMSIAPRSIWLPNNCRKAFAHFGQVYLMRLIFVKKIAHFGQGWLMWLKIATKIDKFHVSTEFTFTADGTTSLKWGSVYTLKRPPMTFTGGIFWIFLYFFVHLLRALPTFLFGKLLLFIIWKIFQNQHVVFFWSDEFEKTC